jgi:hypothetical protein
MLGEAATILLEIESGMIHGRRAVEPGMNHVALEWSTVPAQPLLLLLKTTSNATMTEAQVDTPEGWHSV